MMVCQFHVQHHSDQSGPEGAAENDRGDSERTHRGTTLLFCLQVEQRFSRDGGPASLLPAILPLKPVDANQIGRELGVRYVLEGSVAANSASFSAESGAPRGFGDRPCVGTDRRVSFPLSSTLPWRLRPHVRRVGLDQWLDTLPK